MLLYTPIAGLVLITNNNYFPSHNHHQLFASLTDKDSVFCDTGIETV